jgi:osomolarity two-component system sensor histidine kinase NIK1
MCRLFPISIFILIPPQEYLSKPLKQNHLIETILKCATLGGALLEQSNDSRLTRSDKSGKEQDETMGDPHAKPSTTTKRPTLDVRAYTQADTESNSPAFLSADASDPLDKVSPPEPLECVLS